MATKSGRRYGASASDTEQQSWGGPLPGQTIPPSRESSPERKPEPNPSSSTGNVTADIARILTILEGDPISPDPLRRGLVGWTRTLRQENQALTEEVRALSTRLASIETLLLQQGGPTTPPTQKGADDLETPRPGKEKEPSGSRRSTRFGGSLFGEEEQKPTIPQRRATREPSVEEVEAPSKVKFPKPEKFTGAKGSAAKEFFTKCLVYFKGQGGFDNDEKKIMFILNSMGEGLPSRWANRYLEKIIEMEDDPALESIAAFRDAFLSQWGDPVAKQNAERKIRALYQKGSAADYATEFRTVMPDLEWDNQALKGQFRQGLKPEVRSKMIELTVLSGRDIDAASLDEYIKMAVLVDNSIFEGKRDSRFHKPHEKKDSRPYSSVPATNGKGAYVTPAEKDRRRKAGLCIKCMKAGHTVAVCPSKEWIGGEGAEKGKVAKIEEEGGSSSESEND